MAEMHTQEFFVAATSGTDVVLTGEPVPLAKAVRIGLQLVHVSSASGGSKLKIGVQTTSDGTTWSLASGPTINWTSVAHNAPGGELAEDTTVLSDAAACRVVVTNAHLGGASAASVVLVTLRLQDVR